jgi:hypothetical protein
MIETVWDHEDDSIGIMSSITDNYGKHLPLRQSIMGEKSYIQFVGRSKEIAVLEELSDRDESITSKCNRK